MGVSDRFFDELVRRNTCSTLDCPVNLHNLEILLQAFPSEERRHRFLQAIPYIEFETANLILRYCSSDVHGTMMNRVFEAIRRKEAELAAEERKARRGASSSSSRDTSA